MRIHFRMGWSDQKQIQAHISLSRENFERNWVWSQTFSSGFFYFDSLFFYRGMLTLPRCKKSSILFRDTSKVWWFWSETHLQSDGFDQNQMSPAYKNAGHLRSIFWLTVECDFFTESCLSSFIESEICTNGILNKIFLSSCLLFSLLIVLVRSFFSMNLKKKLKNSFIVKTNRWSDNFERNWVSGEVILSAYLVPQSSGKWSNFGLIIGHFRLAGSDQRQFWAHFERTRCFESTLVWSEDTFVRDGLIRVYFGLELSNQRSLPDGTSTLEVCSFYFASMGSFL